MLTLNMDMCIAAGRAQLPNRVGDLGRELQGRLALTAAGVRAADVAQRKRALPPHGYRLWLCAGVKPHACPMSSCKFQSMQKGLNVYG